MTLLEKASAARVLPGRPPIRPVCAEEIDLALAWLRGEVETTAVSRAFGMTGRQTSNALFRIAIVLRAAYQGGRLQERRT